jgi:hypothetical protein
VRKQCIAWAAFSFAVLILVGQTGCMSPKPDFVEPPASTYSARNVAVAVNEAESLTLTLAEISPEFFRDAKVRPLVGRFFTEAEYGDSKTPVAVISHRWWQERFGSDPAVIGRTFRVAGRQTTIIGIAQPGFEVPAGVSFWIPRTV